MAHEFTEDEALIVRDHNNVLIPIELLESVILSKCNNDNFQLHIDVGSKSETKKMVARRPMTKTVRQSLARVVGNLSFAFSHSQSLQNHLIAAKLKHIVELQQAGNNDDIEKKTACKIIRSSCEYLKLYCGAKPSINEQMICAKLLNSIFGSILIETAKDKISHRLRNSRRKSRSPVEKKTPTDNQLLQMVDSEEELDKTGV